MITKHVITHGNSKIDFATLDAANAYKAANPTATGPVTIQESVPVVRPLVPKAVTSFRIEYECIKRGYWDAIMQIVDNLPDLSARRKAQLAIKRGAMLERYSPLVLLVQQLIPIPDEIMDDIFITAEAEEY